MACLANLNSFETGCPGLRKGGVRAIIVALRSSVTSVYNDNPDIGISLAAASAKRLPFRGSFQSVAQVDESTGVQYFRDELAGFVVSNNETGESNLNGFSAAAPEDLVILVETWSGTTYALGYGWKDANKSAIISTPIYFNGGQLFTGTEKADGNGWNVNLVSVHPVLAAAGYIDNADTAITNPSTD